MKTITFRKDRGEYPDNLFMAIKALKKYYGIDKAQQEEGGRWMFRNNSNYYTPIILEECERKDADIRVTNRSLKMDFFFKRA